MTARPRVAPGDRLRRLFARRWRAIVTVALVLAAIATGAFRAAAPRLERSLRERVVDAARRRGFLADVNDVRLGVWPLVNVSGLSLTWPGRMRVVAESVRVQPALWGHSLKGFAWRVRVGALVVSLPGGIEVDVGPSEWTIRRERGGFRAWRNDRSGRIDVGWLKANGGARLDLSAENALLSDWIELRQRSVTVRDLGTVDGVMHVVQASSREATIAVRARGRGLRLAANRSPGELPSSGEGRPTDAALELNARLWARERALSISDCRLTAAGATFRLRGRLWGGVEDPQVDLSFAVDHVDFAELLATAGLDLPGGARDLGSAAFDASVAGRMLDPGSLVVTQRLDFEPPQTPVPALERLRRPFAYETRPPNGPSRSIVVSPEAEGFVALTDVPPVFVRALLIAEDAGFYGHRGVDLAEVPRALATNWTRGENARGASTISQQLVKNLFLTREKSLSRKLQELALALLIDATLGKNRVLEIYLNVIEWGPNVYGLKPAARHYFGKEPRELTLKEMAFLVSLIPGPLKYQRSFAGGELSPAFETMVASLLLKLRSVEAISEDEYQTALGEALIVRANGARGPTGGEHPVAETDPQEAVATETPAELEPTP